MSKLATEPSLFGKLAIGHLYDGVIYLIYKLVQPKYISLILSYLNLEISARVKTVEALICTRKQNTEEFW